MSRAGAFLDRVAARFAPQKHSRAELFLTRLMFASIVGYGVERYYQPWREQPVPSGIARFIDLTFLADPVVFNVLRVLLAAALISYVVGRGIGAALAVMLALTVAVNTLRASQGFDSGATIVGLVLLGQLVAHLAWPLCRERLARDITVQDLAVHHAQQMIAVVYVLAGIAKLVNSHGRWIVDAPNLAVSMVMVNDQSYYDLLQPDNGLERALGIGNYLLDHPLLARAALGSGLVLELFAFLALLGRRWAFAFGIALIGLHLSILALMKIEFRMNMLILLVFYVNVPFLLVALARRVRPRGAAA